jgi:hypothetical protein
LWRGAWNDRFNGLKHLFALHKGVCCSPKAFPRILLISALGKRL